MLRFHALRRHTLLPALALLFISGCIEGPELTEDSPFTPFSGEFAVVLYHEYHPSYAASENMTQQEYENLLVSVYGENRSIVMQAMERTDTRITIEIPTRNIARPTDCRKDTEGTLVYVDADRYRILNPNSWETFTSFRIPNSYGINGQPQRCSIIKVPARLPREMRR